MGNVHLTTEHTSKFWLVTARGKIIALKEADNDNDKMSKGEGTELLKLMKSLVDLKTGRSKAMPVRGCAAVHYKDPETGGDLIGYYSVSGNTSVDKDIEVCRAVMEAAGGIPIEGKTDHFKWVMD